MKPTELIKLDHLCTEDRERYNAKLTVANCKLPDPFQIADDLWIDCLHKWPPVQYGDIYNYLINTPGHYTAETMKAYKSLDGYNFFVSGHVGQIMYHCNETMKTVCLLKCTVMPSQKITTKKGRHQVWICLDKLQGYVVSAHCTCKAGLGEACSHIAAVLFKIEAAVKLGLNHQSQTSAACLWNRFYKEKVTPTRVSDMKFRKPTYGQTIKVTQKRRERKEEKRLVPQRDHQKEVAALRKLKCICPDAGILVKMDSDTDTASEDETMPPVIVRMDQMQKAVSIEAALTSQCEDVLKDFTVTAEQAANLEAATRRQADCALWRRHRVGRITSTVAHDIKTLKETTSSANCLKKIFKEVEKDISGLASVQYGISNELKAKEEYKKVMCGIHQNFCLRDCGMFLDDTCSVFAASPDGVRFCVCHGEGLLEVKCSYTHKDKSVEEAATYDKDFYLSQGSLALKETHRYYTQVQWQMYVCRKPFCDFVVFTDKGIHVQTISCNSQFVQELTSKCSKFLHEVLLPEIVCRKMTES